jgi:cephalosporin hydroxylase
MAHTPKQILRLWRNWLLNPLDWARSRRAFDRHMAGPRSAEALWQITEHYGGHGYYRGLRANQHPDEIGALFNRARALNPAVVVEIGTRDGATLLYWSQLGPSLRALVSIDLPGGIHGGGYPAARARLYRRFVHGNPGCALHLIRMDSQTEATRDHLQGLLRGAPIDMLFIDGDHRYAGVRRDYDLYTRLVRPGGWVVLHDIYPNTHDESIQVHRLWREIRASGADTFEIVHQPYTGRYGIGVVRVPAG